ncbi:MAG: hypothetical protein ABH833_03980 [Parcubacteria group bacterium]
MEVKRKPNESTGALIRRFGRLAQKPTKQAKAKQYKQRKASLLTEKRRAIMRTHLRTLRKHLQRMGKHDRETFEEEKQKVKRTIKL